MKRILAVALLILMVGTSLSFAQSAIKPLVRVNGGAAIPVGPEVFRDNWDVGFNVGGGVGVILTNVRNTEIFASVNYSTYGGLVDILDIKVLTALATTKVNLMLEGMVIPYVLGGVGLFRMSSDAPGAEAQNDIGAQFGFGVSIAAHEKVNVLVEADYVIGITEGDATHVVPVKGGLAFTF